MEVSEMVINQPIEGNSKHNRTYYNVRAMETGSHVEHTPEDPVRYSERGVVILVSLHPCENES